MCRNLWLGFLSSAFCMILQAQTRIVPQPPFTAQDAERGDQLQAKSAQIRAEIAKMGNMRPLPFKITDNFYSVGFLNGKAYLLTSPQGHIMLGAGNPNTGEIIEKNMQTLGFKLADVKVILLTMWHSDAAGSAAYLRQKSGAQVMVGFPDIGILARGGVLPPGSNQQDKFYQRSRADKARRSSGRGRLSTGQSGSRALRCGCDHSRTLESNGLYDARAYSRIHELRVYNPRREPRLQSLPLLLLGVSRRPLAKCEHLRGIRAAPLRNFPQSASCGYLPCQWRLRDFGNPESAARSNCAGAYREIQSRSQTVGQSRDLHRLGCVARGRIRT